MANWANFEFNDDRFLILEEKEVYLPNDDGKFGSKPDKVERNVVSPKFYENFITAIPFFNNWGNGAYCKAETSQTIAGNLPIIIVTVGPYNCEKNVVEFRFILKSSLEKEAGWREKEVLKNAKEYEMEEYAMTGKCYALAKRITLITEDDGVTHSATWDTGLRKWVD